MKYNKVLCALLVFALAVGLTACGTKDKSKSSKTNDGTLSGTLTGKDDAKAVIDTANAEYLTEKLRGSQTTYVYTYSNGDNEEVSTTMVFDAEKGIKQFKYSTPQDGDVTNFSVKEDDGYYTYESDASGKWIRYKQEPDDNGQTNFEYQATGQLVDFDEENGYEDVNYSNEGVEEIDGKKAVKIKVTAKIIFSTSSEAEKCTKDSVLDEWELSQEAIDAAGLSEILDGYIKAMNASAYDVTTDYETYAWVDVEKHRMLQLQTLETNNETESDTDVEQAIQDFDNQIWRAQAIQQSLEEGASMEDAVAQMEANRSEMEKQIAEDQAAYAEELAAEDQTESGDVVKTEGIQKIVYDKECAEIEDLPTEYETIRESQYNNGDY